VRARLCVCVGGLGVDVVGAVSAPMDAEYTRLVNDVQLSVGDSE